MKIIHIFLILGCASLAMAQVSVISVTDEDKYSKKEDFSHTFEYQISSPHVKGNRKCQATRIGKRWFVTAAHCIENICDKECTIRLDLLEQPISAIATLKHTAKKPAVFKHPQYDASVFVKNDFALFRLDLQRSGLSYYRRPTAKENYRLMLPRQKFDEFLNQNRKAKSQYYQVISPDFPPIALFDRGNYVLDRNLSVISIFDGKRNVKLNSHPVYYLRDIGYAYTKNFGIIQGMSGSGVMTNTGELIGIISGHADFQWKGNGKKANREQYFTFLVFNKEIASFMEEVMGSDYYKLDFKDAYPYLVDKIQRDVSSTVKMFKTIQKK